jgi:20S proteasome alpha/beta subunit
MTYTSQGQRALYASLAQNVDFAHGACFNEYFGVSRRWTMTGANARGEKSDMTVGIALMCEDGKTVVVASDRLVVHEFGSTAIQTEADCIKFEPVGPSVLLLYTGSFNDQQDLVNRIGDIKTCTAFDIATKLRAAYEAQRVDSMERILRRLGASLAALGEEAVRQAQPSNMVAAALKTVSGQFLIAGADSMAGLIYTVSDNSLTLHDHPGFATVGSGSLLAHASLAVRSAHKKLSIEEAICLAYEAKKLAEGTYGVGKKTDMGIVGVGIEARLFREETLVGLEQIYQSRISLKRSDKNTIRRLIEL